MRRSLECQPHARHAEDGEKKTTQTDHIDPMFLHPENGPLAKIDHQ